MKKIIGSTLIGGCLIFAACGSPATEINSSDTSTATMAMDTMATKTYEVSLVNNKKDPTCGMPVTAGISDTAHYEKYVLGFCSKECKDEFLKNPKAAIAAAEVK
jgi:YHS domain-containing protein